MPSPSLAELRGYDDREPNVRAFLSWAGLVSGETPLTIGPLGGGVSSDIWRVGDHVRSLVVKTPLEQLRVQSDWQAPLSRSEAEARWLRTASRLVPGMCPPVLAYDAEQHLLALSYLDPADHQLWKAQLLAGHVVPEVAGEVGARLGRLHRLASKEPELADQFANEDLFRALRIEPYFESLIDIHPDLRVPITRVIEVTLATRTTLVHGDVSPKNILIGPDGPVLLDAETAHWGDPAFDVAFCINHLLLKCLRPDAPIPNLIGSAHRLLGSYLQASGAGEALERRVVRLLPVLLLARVDGRSPVEYLGEDERAVVRETARRMILRRVDDTAALCAAWKVALA